MAKQQNKTLKMNNVKKKAKQNTQMEEYTLHDGSTLKFYPVFPETVIEDLLTNLQELIQEAQEKEIKLSETMHIHLLNLLAIKHMTHLKSQIKGGVLDHIEALDFLRNSGHYKEIIEDVFVPSELQKLQDRLADVIGAGLVLDKIMQQGQEKAEALELKNKEIFEQLNNLGKVKQIPEV